MNKDQFKFVQDVTVLLLYIWEQGWRVTFGEAHRTQSQGLLYYHGYTIVNTADGIALEKTTPKSKTLDSYHLKRLAIDFNFFKPDGDKFTLTYDKEEIQPFGDKWESIDDKNRWGGRFKTIVDTPHFERAI